jgi:protocatechuate 3,4-dioxygenase beta subunit
MKIRKPPAGTHPALKHADYRSTLERAPRQPLVPLPQGATELSGPRFDRSVLYPHHDDLTTQTGGQPLG